MDRITTGHRRYARALRCDMTSGRRSTQRRCRSQKRGLTRTLRNYAWIPLSVGTNQLVTSSGETFTHSVALRSSTGEA